MKGIQSVINLKYHAHFINKTTFQVCIYKVSIKLKLYYTWI